MRPHESGVAALAGIKQSYVTLCAWRNHNVNVESSKVHTCTRKCSSLLQLYQVRQSLLLLACRPTALVPASTLSPSSLTDTALTGPSCSVCMWEAGSNDIHHNDIVDDHMISGLHLLY